MGNRSTKTLEMLCCLPIGWGVVLFRMGGSGLQVCVVDFVLCGRSKMSVCRVASASLWFMPKAMWCAAICKKTVLGPGC